MNTHRKVALEPAFILHHYPYRDSSLLLEVFARGYGRLGLVARGARSAKARWRGQMQNFRPLLLSWSLRGELGTLTGLELPMATGLLAGRRLLSAYYLNELIMRLLARHDPHPEIFDAYAEAIRSIDVAEEPVLRIFEKRMLQALGYGLLLDHEADSGLPIDADAWYEYLPERGPVRRERKCAQGIFLRGSSLSALHRERLADPACCHEVKQLMRAVLALYLGSRPLKTREVLRQLATLSEEGREAGSRSGMN
ncbi:MAG: DNA repair protein RecO [Gammaproteobacteria bacterium]|nr:DNA repair protein RecO [Gammaproteobacteria bacterium]